VSGTAGQDKHGDEKSMNRKVIDVHMHIGGKGNSSPCKMSKRFLSSPAYLYMVVRSGISLRRLLEDHDQAIRTTMIDRLNNAPSVDFGVFLAFDALYRETGEVDKKNSHMITPNQYVMDIARNNQKVLFGASVHPNRGEGNGTEEIDKWIEGGAVLMKWIPNSQIIDPSNKKYRWFYKKLADEDIPLLCHTGPEHAVPVIKKEYQKLGDPRKLRLALSTGVKVIAAHCASPFFPWEESYLIELSDMLEEADQRGWRLYADISAMCTLFRTSIIDDILERIPHHRMVFGSDYPIPIDDMPPYFVETIDVEEFLRIIKIDNPVEKNYQQLLAMDFPRDAMTRGSELLHIPEEKLKDD
jgi:predicted TIM-barrel fold metal-dependent hydrolase